MLMLRQPRLMTYLIFLLIFHIKVCSYAETSFKKGPSDSTNKVEESLITQLNKQPDNLKLRIKIANKFYKLKNYQKTIELLDPYSTELKKIELSLLAAAFKNLKDYKSESRILNLLLASNPNDINILLRLGKSYVAQEKFSEAVEQYRNATKVQPENEKAYFGILEIFKEQKNQYESQVIVKDMIKRFGSKPIYLSELCRIYTEEAYLEEAINSCKQALIKDPKNAENHANLAQCYRDKGDFNMAEKILKTASQKFKNSERIYSMTGDFYFDQKNMSVANRYYSQAVLMNRESLAAQLGMARTSFQLGKYEQALMGFENACKVDNKDSIKHFKEAVTKLRLDGNPVWERKYNSSLFRCMQ